MKLITPKYISVGFLIGFAAVALYLSSVDYRYFLLQREVKAWSFRYPPTEMELERVERSLSEISQSFNPNILWLEAIVLEWRAYNDGENGRFFLKRSEGKLEQALNLREVDSRLWAHLAVIQTKLGMPKSTVNESVENAKRYGAKDVATWKLLDYMQELRQ